MATMLSRNMSLIWTTSVCSAGSTTETEKTTSIWKTHYRPSATSQCGLTSTVKKPWCDGSRNRRSTGRHAALKFGSTVIWCRTFCSSGGTSPCMNCDGRCASEASFPYVSTSWLRAFTTRSSNRTIIRCRLMSSKSAWMPLATLHGRTSKREHWTLRLKRLTNTAIRSWNTSRSKRQADRSTM